MSAKKDKIVLKKGEGIFVGKNAELNIYIKAEKDRLIVSAPFNKHSKTFIVDIYGWEDGVIEYGKTSKIKEKPNLIPFISEVGYKAMKYLENREKQLISVIKKMKENANKCIFVKECEAEGSLGENMEYVCPIIIYDTPKPTFLGLQPLLSTLPIENE